jgi:DNA polymerase elongation subunit (family B)
MENPRVLYFDIETSLQLVAVFQLAHNDWIDPSSLVTERYIICASWMWEGDKTVHAVSVLDDPERYAKDPGDDYHVVKTLHEVLSEADVIIGHNSDNFDKKYIDTRCLYHDLPALPPIASIDTYKVAKAKFMLNSNKLDYIGKLLKVGRKKPTTSGLWMKVLKGDKAAIKEMVSYNKQDVILLKDVFKKLVPYIPNYISRELFGGTGCPRCGSKKFHSRGVQRAITRVYQRFQCQSCMGWFRNLKAEKGSTKFRIL